MKRPLKTHTHFPVLLLVLAIMSPVASAQRTNDAAARRIVSTWTSDMAGTRADVAQFRSLAQNGCNQGQGIDGASYGRCSGVMLTLAEEDLAAAEREYEAYITEAAEYTDEVARRAVWRYAQRRWRELRDADCAGLGLAAGGGSGTGASIARCMADKTRERALKLRMR